MELEEGEGESAPPPKGLDIYERLVEIGNEEALANPGLRELLDAHFSLLPPRYGEVMKFDRAEDVLLHRKILEEAKDPKKRPAFHIRFMKPEDLNLDLRKNTNGIEDGRNNMDDLPERPDDTYIAGHEIIFSTIDKPKLLSQLSALLSDIGLNIREAHVFSTIDGYSLDVFIVDGWPAEDTDGLHKEIEAKIGRKEGSKLEDWEIDKKLLHIGKQIASGSSADLYHGSYLGQDVAIKVLRPEHLQDTKGTEFAQELRMLREVKHKNVVRFIGACVKSPELCIVTEFMPGGDLYEYLHKHRNVLDLTMLLKFALDVSKGMDYLHQNNIIHRDLKTVNLLLDNDLVVKVADFGIARFGGPGEAMTAETGTYRWMAPEVLNHEPYNHKADIFSFGIVLWELATSKLPYDTMTPIQAAVGVQQGKRPELPEKMHPRLSDLIQRCWDTNPDKRPPFREITVELEELLKQQTQVKVLDPKPDKRFDRHKLGHLILAGNWGNK